MATASENPGQIGRMLTLEEWADLDEDEEGEVVDGYLVEEEVPDFRHELIVTWFTQKIRNWLEGRGGFVGGSDAKFAVRPRRGRKPDATVYLPGSVPPPATGLIKNPPDIAIEVVSPTGRDQRRDRVEKSGDYAAFRVRFYWIVDPVLRTLEIFELGRDEQYVRTFAATSGSVEIPGCEGLILPLDQLWAEVDRLSPAEEES